MTHTILRGRNIASQYIRLGMYAQALNVLSRRYPPVIADQSEPGSVSPQDNPLVVYFRGYCREKLGQSGTEDYNARIETIHRIHFPQHSGRVNGVESSVTDQSCRRHGAFSARQSLLLSRRDRLRARRVG